MQTPKSFRNLRQNETEWYILVEYLFSGSLVDKGIEDALTESPLYQTVLESGIPPDCLNELKRTLDDITTEAKGRPNQGRFGLPVYIRLLCQKSKTEDENSVDNPEGYPKDHANLSTHTVQHPAAKINGAWGYFLIVRCEGSTAGSSNESHNCVDLYLYKEGE